MRRSPRTFVMLSSGPDDVVSAALGDVAPGAHRLQAGVYLVPARGPARFYGGEGQAGRILLTRVDRAVGPGSRAGVADGVFAARRAAEGCAPGTVRIVPAGREATAAFLAPLPIEVAVSASDAGLLRRLGVTTLGALARLDRIAVRDRFGPDVLAAQETACGLAPPPVFSEPAHVFRVAVDLEPAREAAEQVAFSCRTAAEKLLDETERAGLLCTAVDVEIRCDSGRRVERRWRHPRRFTAADILDRVRWQLRPENRGAGGDGPDSPVDRVVLTVAETVSAAERGEQLWGAPAEDGIHHGLSRLQGILGHDAVVTGVLTGGRSPAARQMLIPWGDEAPAQAERARSLPWPGSLPPPRPARLFLPPRPARLLAGSERPVALDGRGRLDAEPALLEVAGEPAASPSAADAGRASPVAAWAGPWPVQERWWDEASARSACRVQAVDGSGRAWLLLSAGGQWYAEAQYD